MIKQLFRRLGYVPVHELAEALREKRLHAAAEERLSLQIERLGCEAKAMDEALGQTQALLNTRLAKTAERLSLVVSARRDPKDLQRVRLIVDIELDVFERILFDYQIKQNSADFEYLLLGLFRQIRNVFSTVLHLRN